MNIEEQINKVTSRHIARFMVDCKQKDINLTEQQIKCIKAGFRFLQEDLTIIVKRILLNKQE